MEGKVKWWCDKGYGFIVGENGTDYFVHYSNIIGEGRRNLQEAQAVTFEGEKTPKGWSAKQVQAI